MTHEWKLARRTLLLGERTLLMGVLNVTPDSFSDGGEFFSLDRALAHAEEMVNEGADILDIGGESTRPGLKPVEAEEEKRRVLPVIERLADRIKIPISIDTTKAAVARAALDAGAEIVNDISGLRFDPRIADEAARSRAGLVLMHSRGTLETMHKLEPVPDIFNEIVGSLTNSIEEAERRGVARERIALDPGIGFSKSPEQNLELVARLDKLVQKFPDFPVLIGTSRKSFIGRLLGGAPAPSRLHGTMATVTVAVLRGAHIVRVHDVKAAHETVRVADMVKRALAEERAV
ncbi:MAG: dihydropteroate synthase [Acidobacteria bacterium 13_1_20CM_3_53_8]|nr:MAG: dihydropteroate synthase [Acidobacteria bacterium 13_1_20CM_3_53_8]